MTAAPRPVPAAILLFPVLMLVPLLFFLTYENPPWLSMGISSKIADPEKQFTALFLLHPINNTIKFVSVINKVLPVYFRRYKMVTEGYVSSIL
jgi:hypothetical protein